MIASHAAQEGNGEAKSGAPALDRWILLQMNSLRDRVRGAGGRRRGRQCVLTHENAWSGAVRNAGVDRSSSAATIPATTDQRAIHRPRGAPLRLPGPACARYTTASMTSLTRAICPIGCNILRKSFGSFLCIGVSTIPGATALNRIRSLAYSIAKLVITAFSPPLVIIGTVAFTPAIGWSASAAVMLTTAPDFCFSICSTASCVM